MEHYAAPYQEILNRARPPGRAWQRSDRPHQQWVRVHCRVHWAVDGNEIMDGLVKDWTHDAAHVSLADLRTHGGSVWLYPKDIRRHHQPIPASWRRRVERDRKRRAHQRAQRPSWMPPDEEPNF